MPGTDGFVGVAEAQTPTHYVDNEDTGFTHNGKPVERQRVASYVATGLIPKEFDQISPTYNGDGTMATAVYKKAGATVATLTFTYTSGNCTNIVRT